MLVAAVALADPYIDTIDLFKHAGENAAFFANSYGYAVFPTIGEGGFIVGGAHGTGRVYRRGKYVGGAAMTQVSVGFQAGGQAYSQIVFFQDERAFREFTAGNFELAGGYHKGMAVFTIVKGGAMYSASLGGQRFSYTPL